MDWVSADSNEPWPEFAATVSPASARQWAERVILHMVARRRTRSQVAAYAAHYGLDYEQYLAGIRKKYGPREVAQPSSPAGVLFDVEPTPAPARRRGKLGAAQTPWG